MKPRLEMETGLLPTLVKVTVCGGLTVPTAWFPKLKLEGDSVTEVAMPNRGMDSLWVMVFAVTVSDVARHPLSFGAKVTSIWHAEPMARLVPQSFVWWKSSEFGPSNPILAMSSCSLPTLVMMTD